MACIRERGREGGREGGRGGATEEMRAGWLLCLSLVWLYLACDNKEQAVTPCAAGGTKHEQTKLTKPLLHDNRRALAETSRRIPHLEQADAVVDVRLPETELPEDGTKHHRRP